MGYLNQTRAWLTELLGPSIEDKEELHEVIDEIAAEILDSYKNGLKSGRAAGNSRR